MCSCQTATYDPTAAAMGGDRQKTLNTLGDITGILGGALSGAAGAVDSRRGGTTGFVQNPTASPLRLWMQENQGIVIGGGVLLGLGVIYAVTR